MVFRNHIRRGMIFHMERRKVCFRTSIVLALAFWIYISSSILIEVIESRKNTVAAHSTGYIQENVKATIPTSQIVTSEPLMVVKVFGLIFIDVAVVWCLLWIGGRAGIYCMKKVRHKTPE